MSIKDNLPISFLWEDFVPLAFPIKPHDCPFHNNHWYVHWKSNVLTNIFDSTLIEFLEMAAANSVVRFVE